MLCKLDTLKLPSSPHLPGTLAYSLLACAFPPTSRQNEVIINQGEPGKSGLAWPVGTRPAPLAKRRWEQGITMACGTVSSEDPRRGRVASLATLIYLRRKPYEHPRGARQMMTCCGPSSQNGTRGKTGGRGPKLATASRAIPSLHGQLGRKEMRRDGDGGRST